MTKTMMRGTCKQGCCGRGIHGRTMRAKEKRDWKAYEQAAEHDTRRVIKAA